MPDNPFYTALPDFNALRMISSNEWVAWFNELGGALPAQMQSFTAEWFEGLSADVLKSVPDALKESLISGGITASCFEGSNLQGTVLVIVEKLKVTTDNPSGGKVTSDATYYYDKASGEPKKVVAAVNGMTSTIEITSFKVGEQNIVLPDLSGWTRVDANPNAGINAGTAGAAAANQ